MHIAPIVRDLLFALRFWRRLSINYCLQLHQERTPWGPIYSPAYYVKNSCFYIKPNGPR